MNQALPPTLEEKRKASQDIINNILFHERDICAPPQRLRTILKTASATRSFLRGNVITSRRP